MFARLVAKQRSSPKTENLYGNKSEPRAEGYTKHTAPNAADQPSRKLGIAAAHSGLRDAQRGSNAQPGGSAFSCGTFPGIGTSFPNLIFGKAASNPCV